MTPCLTDVRQGVVVLYRFFCNFVRNWPNGHNIQIIMHHYIYRLFLLLMALAAPMMLRAAQNADKFTVVIDAGHGGKDVGAVDNGVKEKDINLGVALQLGEMLKKKQKDVKVVYTRDQDEFLTLQQRADKANGAKGDIFISIHTNSVDASNKNRRSVEGASTYLLGLHKDRNNQEVARRENAVMVLEADYKTTYQGFDPNSDESNIIFELAQKENLQQSARLASEIQKQLVGNAGRKDRGVHQAGFWVLWATSMPSVLVELDFICNPASAEYISSSDGQKKLAEGIFNAIERYRKSLKGKAVADHHEPSEAVQSSETVVSAYAPKTTVEAPKAEESQKPVATARRRRSEQSRNQSVNRQIETAVITESVPEETNVFVETDLASTPDNVSAKKQKQNSSANLQARAERGRSHGKMDKKTTVYKIQIFASEEHLKPTNPHFCGLSPVSCIRENNVYKYTYGETSNRKEIDEMLRDVRKKIPDAFVIKLRRTNPNNAK